MPSAITNPARPQTSPHYKGLCSPEANKLTAAPKGHRALLWSAFLNPRSSTCALRQAQVRPPQLRGSARSGTAGISQRPGPAGPPTAQRSERRLHVAALPSTHIPHRMAWVEKDHNAHLIPTPCYVQGRQPAAQAAQSHIQPGLECLQGWGIHSLLGQLSFCSVLRSSTAAWWSRVISQCRQK